MTDTDTNVRSAGMPAMKDKFVTTPKMSITVATMHPYNRETPSPKRNIRTSWWTR